MIDLLKQTYLEFMTTLYPYKFIYEYEDGKTTILTFREQDIIHQLGIDRLNKYKIMKSKGEKGIASLALKHLKKDRITMDTIIKDNDKAIILSKIKEYRFLSALLGDTKTEHYEFDHKIVPCDIPAKYLLYDRQKNTHFHFGSIESAPAENEVGQVSPMTWFIEDERPDRYIKNQKRLYVVKIMIKPK